MPTFFTCPVNFVLAPGKRAVVNVEPWSTLVRSSLINFKYNEKMNNNDKAVPNSNIYLQDSDKHLGWKLESMVKFTGSM